MPLHAPFTLGPFLVDADGRVTQRLPDQPPAFVVRWRGRSVRAQMLGINGTEGKLTMQTVLGRVPSSVTAFGERPRSFALLRGLRRGLPGPWTLRLLADHRAVLEAETAITLPSTAVGLVTEVTRFLMSMSPYLDLMDEAGFRAPAA